jgi:leader peptidase (prepilin peptidase) / N-methyltransferase
MATATCALIGLLFGSFLTVVVDRVPRGKSVVSPGSVCGNCGLDLGPLDLVPVLSWIVLRGKCRRCHMSIGIEPLVLEVSTALLFGLMGWHFGLTWRTAAFCALMAGLVALSWIDLQTRRLPRQIIYWTAAIGIPLLCVAALVEHEPKRMWMLALGAAISLALMALIYWGSRGGMGDGDVRLAPLLGAYLGFLNPGIAPVGLFFGFVSGAVVGVVLLIALKGDRKMKVPFGPFMALGTIIAIFIGQNYVDVVLAR